MLTNLYLILIVNFLERLITFDCLDELVRSKLPFFYYYFVSLLISVKQITNVPIFKFIMS